MIPSLVKEIEIIIQSIQNTLHMLEQISSEPIPLGYGVPQADPVQVQGPRQVAYRLHTLKRMGERFIFILGAEASLIRLYGNFILVQVRTRGFTSPVLRDELLQISSIHMPYNRNNKQRRNLSRCEPNEDLRSTDLEGSEKRGYPDSGIIIKPGGEANISSQSKRMLRDCSLIHITI